MKGQRKSFQIFCGLKRGDFQRFIDMEFARLTAGVDTAKIIDTIGEVRIFLDFADDRAGTDGVYGTGGDKISIAACYATAKEKAFRVVVRNAVAQFLLSDGSFQAQENFRTGPIGNDGPHFRFAAPPRS